ncbi:hypothetical protein C4D60_Mb02t21000 [Musa balbisiana]|uniref:AT-hook motif nuclear-localized protein n=1 Tax=Musa balbisiana TaxID=52838 RepID=A0A4S8IC88_MUSBA|nr:hypothetical protein C4D60_Mb02t21000 [Musa balbisiana]
MAVPPPEGAALAMGVMGSGGGGGSGGSSGGDLFGRKKRGRPRKYGPDGMALTLTPTSGSPISPVFSDGKRGRGRPPGSGKYQLLAALGEWFAYSAGGNFTPHVVTIVTGEVTFFPTNLGVLMDVSARILSFSRKGPRSICILSANGAISNVTLRQPGSSGGTLTYEVVVGSFMPNTFKEQKPKPIQQATSPSFPATTGLLTAARPVSQANPEDECETPTSSLPGQSHAENSMHNPTPNPTLHAPGWHGLQSSEHKPSPDINICLQGE